MLSKNNLPTYQKRALLLCALLVLICFCSILWIALSNTSASTAVLYADIYQDGELKQSILLSPDTENYTFTIYHEKDGFNQIEVRHNSIGIISASCPDQICVHQGFIHNSLLPITCLPNRLVIQLRQEEIFEEYSPNDREPAPDIITY